MFDITLLTDKRYLSFKEGDWYNNNVVEEDRLVAEAFTKLGWKVTRTYWDDPDFDWTNTRFALFRTTWDYFDRFDEFSKWMDITSRQTHFINSLELIRWNIDKKYLIDLQDKGVCIPPTLYMEVKTSETLCALVEKTNWKKCILKPAVSGAARHTYLFESTEAENYESIFRSLICNEAMLLQEYQEAVVTKGEVALMIMNGKFTHAVLKKAKSGDFRVQDDFGGTVHDYSPDAQMIEWAENIVKLCPHFPFYARVDMIWNNRNEFCLSELEMIEPELWFRKYHHAALELAKGVTEHFK